MYQLLFLEIISITLASISLEFQKQCQCSEYIVKQDCEVAVNCLWENNIEQCKPKTCADYKTKVDCGQLKVCKWDTTCLNFTRCLDYNNETICDDLHPNYNCAWNGEKCDSFTSCSDYVPGKTGCILKSSFTQNCQSNDTGTACENATTYACSDSKTADTCKYQSLGGPCFFGASCNKITQCNQFTDPNECEAYKCYYETKCREKLCSDYKTETDCTYVKNIFKQTGTLCEWDKNCAEAIDISKFQIKTCNKNTGYTYKWDSNQQKCVQCQLSGQTGSGSGSETGTGSNKILVSRILLSLLIIYI